MTVPRVERRLVAPDPVHQLIAREDTARMASEEQEQVELARGQARARFRLYALHAPRHRSRCPRSENAPRRPAGRSAAAQHCAHSGDELPRRERLRHVVVGTELEPDDPVRLLAAGGEHDHGQLRARTDPAAELEPVGAGQHHVKHDEARPLPLQQAHARASPSPASSVAKALAPQVLDDHLADSRLVVDDQNRLHPPILPASPYKTLKSDRASGTAEYENVRRLRPAGRASHSPRFVSAP